MQLCINMKEKLSRDFKAPKSFMQLCINILHEVYESSQVEIEYVFQKNWEFVDL